MNINKIRTLSVKIPLYNDYKVILLIGGNVKKISNLVAKYLPEQEGVTEEWLERRIGATFFDGHMVTVMWQRGCDMETPEDVATLCHECLHVAADICAKTGIYVGEHDYNKEALAYLQEFIFKHFFTRLKQRSS